MGSADGRGGPGWSDGHDGGRREAGVRAQVDGEKGRRGPRCQVQKRRGVKTCAQKPATGGSLAPAGQPDPDAWGRKPGGGGGEAGADHGWRWSRRGREAPYRAGQWPQGGQEGGRREGSRGSWLGGGGAGRCRRAPCPTGARSGVQPACPRSSSFPREARNRGFYVNALVSHRDGHRESRQEFSLRKGKGRVETS